MSGLWDAMAAFQEAKGEAILWLLTKLAKVLVWYVLCCTLIVAVALGVAVGAPAAMNFGNIRLLNVTHSAASFVQTDDLESFVRAQKGLRSHATDWVDISRGLGDEEPDRELNATRALATHEMVVRAQYKAWLGYMREAA